MHFSSVCFSKTLTVLTWVPGERFDLLELMFLGLGLQASWLKFFSLQPCVETPYVTSGSCSVVIYFTSEDELLGNQTPRRF